MPPKTKAGAKPEADSGDEGRNPGIRAFRFLGMDLEENEASGQAQADCPFCGKEGKWFASLDEGLWDCKVCGAKGNPATFLRDFWAASFAATGDAYEELTEARGLILPEGLDVWCVARSMLTKEWLVPGFNVEGKLCQLYRWAMIEGKRRLIACPGFSHHLIGPVDEAGRAQEIYLAEGPWDGLALWETLRSFRTAGGGKLVPTANAAASLADGAAVLSVPSCSVFKEAWLDLFAGKDVVLMYDNDWPKKNRVTGAVRPPAGIDGMRRAAEAMASAPTPPRSIRFLRWGKDEPWHDPSLPDGCDLRDMLGCTTPGGNMLMEARRDLLANVLSRVAPIPEAWAAARSKAAKKSGGTDIEEKKCESWKLLRNAWRKAMKWTPGLDRALVCMLSTVASTMAGGDDQLWMKIIGPPSCGKSTLCEALAANRKHIKSLSTFRGFHSGFRSPKGEGSGDDNSLVQHVRDRTLVIKDGDTLLQLQNLTQVLSEARDIYDRVSRSHYRNGMGRDEDGVNMTFLLCGTASLRALDSSELGERFVDCVIMEDIDEDLEDEVLDRKARSNTAAFGVEANCAAETRHSPEKLEAYQLTAGYITWLRANAVKLAGEVRWDDEAIQGCKVLAKLVSYLRARPSPKQEESTEREMAARLLSQLMRLATFAAVVTGKKSIDAAVFALARACALDTCRGWTYNICRALREAGDEGKDHKTVAYTVCQTPEKTLLFLRFLQRLKAVELFRPQKTAGYAGQPKWRLSSRMLRLWDEVVSTAEEAAREAGAEEAAG